MNAPEPDDDAPGVSVIIPAYNAERFVGEAIESVLAQTWRDLECIVVDDGSTDATGVIASGFDDPRVVVVSKKNERTVALARNVGLDAARAPLIAFLDADDVWLPPKLEKQIALLRRRADVGLVVCGYAISDEQLHPRTIIVPDRWRLDLRDWLLQQGNGIGVSSTGLLRRDVVDIVGRFNPLLSVSEDCDFATRVAEKFTVECVDEALVLYRAHNGQGHLNLRAFEHDMTWIYEDRRGRLLTPKEYRTGMSNLHTRLMVYRTAQGDLRTAGRHLRVALRHAPLRLVRLPAEAFVRRARRRWRGRELRPRGFRRRVTGAP